MEILDVDEVGTGVREPRREKVVTVIKTGLEGLHISLEAEAQWPKLV